MEDQRSDPPGAVSDQMPEEQPSPLRNDERHPEPRRDDAGAGSEAGRVADDENEGEATEGSQSTGHPENAG
jgi:hypothetical protein